MKMKRYFVYLAGSLVGLLVVLFGVSPTNAIRAQGSHFPVVKNEAEWRAGSPENSPRMENPISRGALDGSFGVGGLVTTAFPNYLVYPGKVLLQHDGKIIVAGIRRDNNDLEDYLLIRYLTNGSLDQTFGVNGKVITSVGRYDVFGDMAIQSDGKIVITGISCIYSLQPCLITLVRYLPNGSLDPTFGVNGKLREKYAGTLSTYSDRHTSSGIAIQTDGKIVIAGTLSDAYDGAVDVGSDLFIFRYNPDGTRDSTFGVDGRLIIDYGNKNLEARDLVIQEDGKIILAGEMNVLFLLLRYNLDGSLDATFGNNGKITTFVGKLGYLQRLVVQADQRILAVGSTFNTTTWEGKTVILRYNTNGSLDTDFNYDGKLVIDAYPGFNEWANDLAIRADGKIMLAGAAEVPCGSGGYNSDFFIVRLTPKGFLDGTFYGKGWLTININSYAVFEFATGIAIQPDQKMLILGMTENPNIAVALLRMLP